MLALLDSVDSTLVKYLESLFQFGGIESSALVVVKIVKSFLHELEEVLSAHYFGALEFDASRCKHFASHPHGFTKILAE